MMKSIVRACLMAIGAFLIVGAPIAAWGEGTLFSFKPPAGARSVRLAGSFTEWDGKALLMSDADGDGTWTVEVELRPGKYEYKYMVDDKWLRQDGKEGDNSVIEVKAGAVAAAPMTAVASTTASTQNGKTAFSFKPPAGARSVRLAGSFTDWDAKALPMSDADGDGTFMVEVELRPGKYEYKYMVDDKWLRQDGKEGDNSVIEVKAVAVAAAMIAPVASKPVDVMASAVMASAPPASSVMTRTTFSLRAPTGTKTVFLSGTFDGVTPVLMPMMDGDGDGIWTVEMNIAPGSYDYKFIINATMKVAAGSMSAVSAPASTTAARAASSGSSGATTFSYKAPAGTRSVSLAGSFNDWSSSAAKLSDADGDGIWTIDVKLAPGTYQYKFVVNATDWLFDPTNPTKVDDGLGGQSSVLVISSAAGAGGAANARASPMMASQASQASRENLEASAKDFWAQEKLHHFAYRPAGAAGTVAVAGSFNNWSLTATPMSDLLGDGQWTADVELPAGKIVYKFVVNSKDWIADPLNPNREPDGQGGDNTVISREPLINPESCRGDGVIDEASLEHRHVAQYMTRSGENQAILTIRIDRNDVDAVSVVIGEGDSAREIPLEILTRNDRYEFWRGRVEAPADTFSYHFVLHDGAATYFVKRSGLMLASAGSSGSATQHGRDFVMGAGQVFTTPQWAKAAVIYQIFPDRFRDGDLSNDVPSNGIDNFDKDHARPWTYEPLAQAPSGWFAFYGGDLQGVKDKLDYIADLGINTVKFNPIFSATGNSKYDVTDYFSVDPVLGSNALFESLVREGSGKGIRFLLDGVFNHSGERHPYFVDARDKGPSSQYYDWYRIHKWPFSNPVSECYETFQGFGGLPAWNTENPVVRNYLLEVAERWTAAGIAGWRLDAADAVEHDFWREFRARVKARNPEAYLVGEIWPVGTDWLQGDQFDATMNYALRGALVDFFADEKIDAGAFANRVADLVVAVAPQAYEDAFNMLSSHDTPRFYTLCGRRIERVKQAVAFQFSHAGAPVIFYGEEIGMEGGPDPDNRRAFPWDKPLVWNQDLRRFYQRVIALRKENPALASPTWNPLYAKGRVLVAAVHDPALGGEKILLVFNASDASSSSVEFDLPASFPVGDYTDLLNGKNMKFDQRHVTIPRLEARATSYLRAA